MRRAPKLETRAHLPTGPWPDPPLAAGLPLARWLCDARRAARKCPGFLDAYTRREAADAMDLARRVWRTLDPEGYRKAKR